MCHCVAQVGLKLVIFLPQVLGSQAYATLSKANAHFKVHLIHGDDNDPNAFAQHPLLVQDIMGLQDCQAEGCWRTPGTGTVLRHSQDSYLEHSLPQGGSAGQAAK
jgi:hypothetical protein